MNVLQQYLTPQEAENLRTETNYLESTLNRQAPDKSLLKAVTNNILEIIKAVPANIIANVLTNMLF